MLKIKELRIKKGITQKELADFLGVGANAVSMYENGYRKLNHFDVVKVALFLDTTPDELLGFEEAYKKYSDYLMSLKKDEEEN